VTDRQPAPVPADQDLSIAPDISLWHLGWLAVLVASVGFWLLAPVGPSTVTLAALALGASPALAGTLLAQSSMRIAQPLILVNWGIAMTLAVVLTGGLAGPLTAWLLAPVAAAVAMGRVERLALGSAISLGAVGLSALAGVTLQVALPDASLSFGLGFIASGTMALGLSAGLVMLQRRVSLDLRRQEGAEARLRDTLDELPQLLVSLYPGGKLVAAWGHTPRALRGQLVLNRPIADLTDATGREAISAALGQAVLEGIAEVGFAPRSDPSAWLGLTLRRINSTRIMGVIRDASAQREREATLETARSEAEAQNAGKSRFLANMSHELRTPLNAIMGFSDIMRQRLFGDLPPRYADYAELIHESGEHLLELINDVLDMSKIEAERFELSREEFDARDALSAVLRLMRGQADRAGVSLRGVLPKDEIPVSADRRALKQIALNLISNALKFTPRGGSVTVSLHGLDQMLEIVVSDTGIGIGADDLQRLGRPFEQAGGADQRAEGTGLGLSLVRAFAQLHDGEMQIESELGEGTTITVRLPVVEVAPAPAAEPVS
jgi:cell cycle sensor histidine kinase DivJ